MHIPFILVLGCDRSVPQLFCRLDLNPTSSSSSRPFFPDFEVPYSTPFTTAVLTVPSNRPSQKEGTLPVLLPTLRAERTALLVSSTSWTADEDFGLLLEALEIYNRVASAEGSGKRLPRILVIITGKGPLKDMYMGKIRKLQLAWDFVRCISTWLDAADYPLLLGCSVSPPCSAIPCLQVAIQDPQTLEYASTVVHRPWICL